MGIDQNPVQSQIQSNRDRHLQRLRDGCRVSFGGLESFQGWFAEQLQTLNGVVREFRIDESILHDQPAMHATLRNDLKELRTGPNLTGEFFQEHTSSVLLYAHADTEPVTREYVNDSYGVEETTDRISAPGVADDISGVTAILSAVEAVHRGPVTPKHSVSVASILGKQCGVAGTYPLVRDHDPTDAAVYVHPAESETGLSEIKTGSNGVVEFDIDIQGQTPDTSEHHHTLFAERWYNPIETATQLQTCLYDWVAAMNDRYYHKKVSDLTGRSMGLLFGDLDVTETAAYQVPSSCRLRGTVSFPPNASLTEVQSSFENAVADYIGGNSNLTNQQVALEWGDIVVESAEADLESPVVETTASVLEATTGTEPSYYFGHSASDIRYPICYWGTQTIGFGPKAGAMGKPTEWIDRDEYLDTITALAKLLTTSIDESD